MRRNCAGKRNALFFDTRDEACLSEDFEPKPFIRHPSEAMMVLPGVWPLNSHELNRDSSNRGWGQRARTPRAVQPGLPIVSMVQVRTLLLYQNAVVVSEYPARPESAVHAILPQAAAGLGHFGFRPPAASTGLATGARSLEALWHYVGQGVCALPVRAWSR